MTKPKAVSMNDQLAQGSASQLKMKQNHHEIYRNVKTKNVRSYSCLTETSPNFFIFVSLYSFYLKWSLCVKHSMITSIKQ